MHLWPKQVGLNAKSMELLCHAFSGTSQCGLNVNSHVELQSLHLYPTLDSSDPYFYSQTSSRPRDTQDLSSLDPPGQRVIMPPPTPGRTPGKGKRERPYVLFNDNPRERGTYVE